MRLKARPALSLWLGLGLAIVIATAPQGVRAADEKPNFIVIFVDDLGYGDIGPFGSKRNRTPNLDRMAAEGRMLTCFYAAPVCSPSRASLMTGCYPKRVGIPQVLFPADPTGLADSERTLPELLKERGYATMCIGKWHLGDQPEFLPRRHGFDHYFGLPYSNDMGPAADGERDHIKLRPPAKKQRPEPNHPPLPLLRDERVVEVVKSKEQGTLGARYTEEAVSFLEAHKAGPFFLYLPHTAVHLPHFPGPQFRGRSSHGVYSDWVEEVDWSVGRVLDAVRKLGLSEKTLVLFTSDNGGANWPNVSNAPLRGMKASTWEGGMREPTIAWWPGKVPAGTATDAITSTMDVLPTLVTLAGGTVPNDRIIDGKDITPLLLGTPGATSPYEAFYYFRIEALEAVRSGPWKLVLNGPKLYNLDRDIGETTDVASRHPEIVKRLEALAETMRADLGDGKSGPGCRPAGHVERPRPLIDHEGDIRPDVAGTSPAH